MPKRFTTQKYYLLINYISFSQDLKDALEAKETMENDTVELNEAVEMATLDKEMAEEKVRRERFHIYLISLFIFLV